MMGVSCGKDGLVTVTDDDVIEKSNLSRQFLFRNYNVSQSKSMAATKAIQEMNASIHVQAIRTVSRRKQKTFTTMTSGKVLTAWSTLSTTSRHASTLMLAVSSLARPV